MGNLLELYSLFLFIRLFYKESYFFEMKEYFFSKAVAASPMNSMKYIQSEGFKIAYLFFFNWRLFLCEFSDCLQSPLIARI